jgi:hypothetical protein
MKKQSLCYLRIASLLSFIVLIILTISGCGGGGGVTPQPPPPVVNPPRVISHTPEADSVDISTTSTVSITFDKSMDKTSVESAFQISPHIEGNITWENATNKKMTFASSNLTYSTTYTVTVQKTARSSTGLTLEEPYSWSFSTFNYSGISVPEVIGRLTVGNNVPINSNVSLTFNRPMNETSVEESFRINPENENDITDRFREDSVIDGTFEWQNNTMIFTPAEEFSPSTTYTATILAGATDLEGNPFEENYSWNFTTAEDTTKHPKYFALLIGINDYPGTLNDLRWCVNDVLSLKSALEDSPVWQKNRAITILTDTNATKDNIRNAIESIKATAEPDDKLIVHYSGHGTNNIERAELVVWNNNNGLAYITDVELASWLSDMPCPTTVFLDCCHSGGFIGRALSTYNVDNDLVPRVFTDAPYYDPYFDKGWSFDSLSRNVETLSNIVAVTASKGSELSHESANLKHGVFTYFVVQGLGTGASMGPADLNSNGAISAEEIHTYVEPLVPGFTSKMTPPRQQTPQIVDNYPTAEDNTEQLEIKK